MNTECPTCGFPGAGHYDPCTNKTFRADKCADERCTEPLSLHIGGKSCVTGKRNEVRSWWHLPTAAGAWSDAARGR